MMTRSDAQSVWRAKLVFVLRGLGEHDEPIHWCRELFLFIKAKSFAFHCECVLSKPEDAEQAERMNISIC